MLYAFIYARVEQLTAYSGDDGRIEIDNKAAERAIRAAKTIRSPVTMAAGPDQYGRAQWARSAGGRATVLEYFHPTT
jgi:hypothetical protein